MIEIHLQLKYSMKIATVLFLTEPITKMAPKITSGEDFNRLKVPERNSIAFLCPAQASPPGSFR